ncbi:rhoptry neck protein ron5 [Cystoisospora suis]|uniref:Rhoptry neck protein ron5 n=1 Tax=Cystoisospora suis TaxID=483139 RepID=A0A2C6L548_9APIC|nr:rhoptry neck protein ron5 [Cystoisospora suis]
MPRQRRAPAVPPPAPEEIPIEIIPTEETFELPPPQEAYPSQGIFEEKAPAPAAMNVGAPASPFEIIHAIDCQVVNGQLDCSGTGIQPERQMYQGGIGFSEAEYLTRPTAAGPDSYDEDRPEPRPQYLSAADYQTWNQFNILTENSAQELFADAASACLARRKPTYSCTLLQEYAATSILVEESGNLVCERRQPAEKEGLELSRSLPSPRAAASKPPKAGAGGKPARGMASPAPTPSKGPKSAFVEVTEAGEGEDPSTPESDDDDAGVPPSTTIASTDASTAMDETTEEGTALSRPPPTNPSHVSPTPVEEVQQRVAEALEETRPLRGEAIERFQTAAAESRGDQFAKVAAYNAMHRALKKISSLVIMSQCKRFLEAFSKNPGAFSGQVAVHLNELQLQMLSTLVEDFSLAQHLIGYPMLVVQDALNNLSDAVVLNALTQITAIERLIHFVAGEKSRLAAKGEDTLENVRKSVFHEAYRELSLKAFQEIIDKVCDMIDAPESYERLVVSREAPAKAPLRTGGNLGAEYINHLRDDLCDVTSSDMQIFPSAPADDTAGILPTHNLGERMLGWMDHMARSKIVRKDVLKIVDFTDADSVLTFASDSWKGVYAALHGVNTPAPSFNAMASSGCRSVNQEIRGRYFDLYTSNSAFARVQRDTRNARQRLQQRVTKLRTDGLLPQLPLEYDYELMALTEAMQSGFQAAIHASYGYLDLCDQKCFQQVDRLHHDVMATIFYSLDRTLQLITAKMHRAYGLGKTFFQIGHQKQKVIDPDLRSWSIRLFDYWENHNEVRRMKGLKPVKTNYKKLQPDEYTIETVFMRDALVRYTNMLKHDPKTADMMNLILHTWVQIRGVRNAAYGFKSSSKKLNERIGESAVGAIFSKLWYERDPTVVSAHQHLKPFGAPLASMALQIAFYLHTVVEEYNLSALQKAGAVVKSFFVGLFQKQKKRTIPRTWNAVVSYTQKKPKVNLRQYQGGLLAIKNLSKMFRERFLHKFHMLGGEGAGVDFITPTLLVHSLVALWMDPSLDRLDLSSPYIPQAKKLFWYYTWVNENGPSNVATRIVLVGCKNFKFLHPGIVRYVKGVGGEVTKAGSNILKMRRIRLTRSDIESNMNLLQATYDDPLTVIQVGLDLAERCQGYVPTTLDRRGDHPVWQKEDLIDFSSSIPVGGVSGGLQFTKFVGFTEIQPHAHFMKGTDAEDLEQDFDHQEEGESHEEEDFLDEDNGGLNEDEESINDYLHADQEEEQGVFVEMKKLRKLFARKKKPEGFATIRSTKLKKGQADSQTSAAILSSKFMLDLWCTKYRNMIVDKLSGIKLKDQPTIEQEIAKVFNDVTSIRIAIPTFRSLWDLSLKCDWMADFPDQEKTSKSRSEMVTYALAHAGKGARLRRAFQKLSSWTRKKGHIIARKLRAFGGKLKEALGRAPQTKESVPDWATINVGLEQWTGRVFAPALSFNERQMMCNGSQQNINVIAWGDNGFIKRPTTSNEPGRDFVLCKRTDTEECWATREALMYKGWGGMAIYQNTMPRGYWVNSLIPPGSTYIIDSLGRLTTGLNLTLQDIFPSAQREPLSQYTTMRIVGSDGNIVYEGKPTAVVQTPGGSLTLAKIRDLVSSIEASGENVQVNLSVGGRPVQSIAELDRLFQDNPNLVIRDISLQQMTVPNTARGARAA